MAIDANDRQLVQLLQEDSKKTIKQYADVLGLSNTAVYERIKRLERTGVISKYVALVDKNGFRLLTEEQKKAVLPL